VSKTQAATYVPAGLALAVLLLGAHPAGADCSIAIPNVGGAAVIARPTAPVGQSFVACADGLITHIALYVGISTQASVRLGLEAGTDLLAPAFTQLGTIPTGATRILFHPGFPVTGGMLYSLSLAPISGVLYMGQIEGTTYPDGSLITVEGDVSVLQSTDLPFSVAISDAPVPARIATWGEVKFIYR